ncbi:hypothetical protein HYH02_006530 [Chlamydomonas schloesseri]|uniref:GRF-type domain-containing protein n=1 Tax=Chlamydomonas schloesseri TaxID=2026947 RepID=A0A836B688_9CHLO|nr:hypothetical protein HYH02_006530 [Chlamydomonas schloesseri]|eukprot:KAG2448643.1 hypothetical protein HYH02_006530 [Chlamydomonas schloesseri]
MISGEAGAVPQAVDATGGPTGERDAGLGVRPPDAEGAAGPASTSGRPAGGNGSEPPAKRPRLADLFAKPTAKTFSRQVHDLFLVLDLEATCTKRRDLFPIEIIELSCVLLDAHSLAVRGEFQAYVRPTEHPRLDPFCVELTGIEQHQVDAAPLLGEVLGRLQAWLEGLGALPGPGLSGAESQVQGKAQGPGPEPGPGRGRGPGGADLSLLPVTWTDWDLKVCLETECEWRQLPRPPYLRRWCNLKRLFTQRYKRTSNLRACVESLGLEWQGRAHSGLDDSRNTAALVAKMARDGAVLRVTDSFKQQPPQQAQQPVQQPPQQAQQPPQQPPQPAQHEQQGRAREQQAHQGAGEARTAAGGDDGWEGPGRAGATLAAVADGEGTPTRGGDGPGEQLDPGGSQVETPGAYGRGGGSGGGVVRAAGGSSGKGSASGRGKGCGLKQTVLSITPRKQEPSQPLSSSASPAADSAAAGDELCDGGALAALAAVLPSAATAPPLYDSAGRWLGRCRCGVAARSRTVKKPGPNLGRHFYSCGRWTLTDRSRQCNFFAFADSLQLAPGAAPAGGRAGGGGSGARR